MSIEILPARLANQIAAGEVVERPASVIKELVENSLDAGATKIQIDIEKGGAKRIRIIDNGKGIVKDELTLALSRHATSKIKDLNDLEAISSLGFRGEALASISSVARLTLTSKPAEQSNAWQAYAEGRDMQVVVQPAAHPNGTTIDVEDLFFNTPARKKFLRTEKTEFSHIEEVIKRIALARFDVTFILNHNHKQVRQYRAARDKSQYGKRVAQICGQRFIDNAIEVDCQHDNLHLSGWLATPEYFRNQNDLSYSYVNGRMMRDKLINHAIRQAYAQMLPRDTYPAFVLFLELDFKDVDVNVHPAKHEVRFHQGRYVHDFIYSVCEKALTAQVPLVNEELVLGQDFDEHGEIINKSAQVSDYSLAQPSVNSNQSLHSSQQQNQQPIAQQSYIKPLQQRDSVQEYQPSRGQSYQGGGQHKVTEQASQAYQALMTPLEDSASHEGEKSQSSSTASYHQKVPEGGSVAVGDTQLSTQKSDKSAALASLKVGKLQGHFVAPHFAVMTIGNELRLVALPKIEQLCQVQLLQAQWHQGLVSQPLLLPIKLKVNQEQLSFVNLHKNYFEKLGMFFNVLSSTHLQIRQFPALLRHKDVSTSFFQLLDDLQAFSSEEQLDDNDWQETICQLMISESYDQQQANSLLTQAQSCFGDKIEAHLHLNSVAIDLTSEIQQLKTL